MGLKETRQHIFNDWADALLNKDWESCDTCAMLLIHTLTTGSEHRKTLEEWIDWVNRTGVDKQGQPRNYDSEMKMLQDLINSQNNPFQREQLKNKKPELDEWRANEIHNKFFIVCSQESLIDKDK